MKFMLRVEIQNQRQYAVLETGRDPRSADGVVHPALHGARRCPPKACRCGEDTLEHPPPRVAIATTRPGMRTREPITCGSGRLFPAGR